MNYRINIKHLFILCLFASILGSDNTNSDLLNISTIGRVYQPCQNGGNSFASYIAFSKNVLPVVAAAVANNISSEQNCSSNSNYGYFVTGTFFIAVTPNGEYVYACNHDDSEVRVIRTSDNMVVEVIDITYPLGIAITPDGSYVYIASYYNDALTVVRTSDNTVISSIAIGDGANGIAITPDGQYAYITIYNSDIVKVLQISNNTVVGSSIVVGDAPAGVAITPDGQYVYVTNRGAGTVSVIRTSDNTVVGSPIVVGTGPYGIAITPDGQYVYVANLNVDTVSVIRTSDNTVVGSPISVGDRPFGISITLDGLYAYISNSYTQDHPGDPSISVIDILQNIVVATVDAFELGNAQCLALTPDDTRLYVVGSTYENGVVNVISTESNTVVDTIP